MKEVSGMLDKLTLAEKGVLTRISDSVMINQVQNTADRQRTLQAFRRYEQVVCQLQKEKSRLIAGTI